MDKKLQEVPRHMIQLGLGALAHANWHANYASFENELWPALSVIQAAHAAEILIKARIAEEHPLLIFEQLPRSTQLTDKHSLEIRHLVQNGRTFQYADLPERLWATTNICIPALDCYQQFGKLRNSIQHFSVPPDIDLNQQTIEYIYDIIDPFINECWGLYAIDYNEDYEPHIYLAENLIRHKVKFLVSPESLDNFEVDQLEWPDDPNFKNEMQKRFDEAHRTRNRPKN